MKTCIWCTNPCEYYLKVLTVQCNELFGNEATQLRQLTAENCENYKEIKL